MSVTYNAGKILNPLSSAVTGGTTPSGNVIIDVSSWADAVEPRRTAVLTRCKKGKAVDQIKHEWGQSYHTPLNGTINEALDNSETGIDLASGQGKWIQQWMVVEIIDWVSGSSTVLDRSTRELVVVRSHDGTDTITAVQRGAGGTSAVTHSSGAYWGIVGVALPHSTDFAFSPFTRGDRLYNFPQRFYGQVGADEAARVTPTYEHPGDQLLSDFEKETLKQKHLLEHAIVSGGRQEGDNNSTGPSTTTQNPYMMGGIDYFITNHSGRVTNLSGAVLSAYDLEDILYDMYTEVDDGGAKTLLMSGMTARIFDTFLNPIREATVTDTGLTLYIDKLKFRWGELEIMHTQHMFDNAILFVDFSKISVHPYKGMDWKSKDIATAGPYDKRAIYGEFTLKVDEVQTMGKIHNFNSDLVQYPRREWF